MSYNTRRGRGRGAGNNSFTSQGYTPAYSTQHAINKPQVKPFGQQQRPQDDYPPRPMPQQQQQQQQQQGGWGSMPPAPEPPVLTQAPADPVPPLADSFVPKQETTNGAEPEDISMVTVDGSPDSRKKFRWRRTSGDGKVIKVPKKIRKKRLNARLRNLLCPKNAIMVVHEIYPDSKININEEASAPSCYVAEVEIEGIMYTGRANSKMTAKQQACEKALRGVLLQKINNSKKEKEAEDVVMEPAPGEVTDGAEGGEAKIKKAGAAAEDDVPWSSIASYALYKLFTDWQAQGLDVSGALGPVGGGGGPTRPPAGANPVGPTGAPAAQAPYTHAAMKKVPENPHTIHPVMLLNQLRPGLLYSESRQGLPPNFTFTFSVQVDGQTYQGSGPNKKQAKKAVAVQVLKAIGILNEEQAAASLALTASA